MIDEAEEDDYGQESKRRKGKMVEGGYTKRKTEYP